MNEKKGSHDDKTGDASSSWSLGPEQKRKEKILPIRALIVDGMFVVWCAVVFCFD